jgi:basic amino acid/polyamine antiporter, APA family
VRWGQALTTTILAGILGMPRIFLAMARDGLLFSMFRTIHPRFGTPFLGTIITGGTGPRSGTHT